MKYILIDDDLLIHELWKMAARGAGLELMTYLCVDDFLADKEELPRNTRIYVDSNLKDAKGEEEVLRIREAGFDNLYIATGYNPEDIKAPDFVLGVIGKRPPF